MTIKWVWVRISPAKMGEIRRLIRDLEATPPNAFQKRARFHAALALHMRTAVETATEVPQTTA